ncbi:MarR family winged helix-turn-helix transcriptional regulator [Chitinophaga sp. sic0106]|uniref:MarR family winged helix-turn-helix transcriptional regulator n=1 Tax=Chitinophaga sp. sic0106 TaxID=2854785 RepID=UPI001C459BD1|nr:MarR family transcriptional regulator [Chitinophaga sp. sic0106]MBV7530690.1 MarR family transcriptional regulator [Chitinophaga sp. sic0106]
MVPDHYLKLDSQFCFPIYALSREITQLYRQFLDQLDITYPQYLVLMVLWQHDKQTVNQLGDKLLLDSGTLTPLLKRLEQKALVNRNRSKADERVVEISLTVAGAKLKEQASCIPREMFDLLGISLEEMETLKSIAHKILQYNAREQKG